MLLRPGRIETNKTIKVHDAPVQEQRYKYIAISFKIIRLQIVNIGTFPYILT